MSNPNRWIRLIVMLAGAAIVGAAIEYRIAVLNHRPISMNVVLFSIALFLAFATIIGFLNMLIAAGWSSLRHKPPQLLAAFSFGIGLFVGIQALGHLSYEYYKARPDLFATTQSAPYTPSEPSKETK